jgi:hypothetical protein
MYKRKKLKSKKLRRGSTGFEGSPEMGGRGTTQTYGEDQSRTTDSVTATPQTKVKISGDTATSAVLTGVGKLVDLTGLGLVYEGGKKLVQAVRPKLTPKLTKQTDAARLSGSPIYDYSMKRNIPTSPPGGDSDNQPLKNILKKPIKSDKPVSASFRPKDFFPFQAYKSGGVPSGPPPLKGPNPQVPPVKFRKGKMTKTYKFSCPSRPDGIRGMGAAIKGHKFIGVK